jgi:hypothetical protein
MEGWRWCRSCLSYPDGVLPARSVLAIHAAAVAIILVACTSKSTAKPVPPFVPDSSTTTTILDFSTVDLAAVAGRTVVHVPIFPGPATLNGTVTGPGGAIAGADVHVERVVDGSIGTADVSSQADGTWSLPGIQGGLYRVRAWRSPDLTLTRPTELYLAATDTKSVDLRVDTVAGKQVSSAMAPSPPIIGVPAQLVVEATSSTVDGQGVMRQSPLPGVSIELFGDGQWSVTSSSSQTADGTGTARWLLTCEQLGPQPLSVVVNSADVFPLALPPCSPVPTTTTVPTPSSGPTASTVPTSSTLPTSSSVPSRSTTTTPSR